MSSYARFYLGPQDGKVLRLSQRPEDTIFLRAAPQVERYSEPPEPDRNLLYHRYDRVDFDDTRFEFVEDVWKTREETEV